MVNNDIKNFEEKIKKYIEEYIKIGLDNSEFSFDEASKIIKELYNYMLEKPEPNEVIIVDSPMAAHKYITEKVGKISFVWPYLSGSFDVSSFAYYDFLINEFGVKIDEILMKKYNAWRNTMRLGLIYPFDDICIVTKKPLYIKMNKNGLHCENGSAVKYPDGFEIYALNGVRMKKEYVMTPWDKLDAKIILKEKNAEVRRELVRKIGIEKVCEDLDAKVIDKDGDYELLLLDLEDGRRRPYLKMKNPSIGVYHIEGVHPDCKTVADALKWRNRTDENPIIIT